MHTKPKTLAQLATVALLFGCNTVPPSHTVMSTQGTTVVRRAQVTEIRDVVEHGGAGSGVGSAIGAVVGSVAGSALGSGYGRAVGGIGGAVAGAVAGRQVEQAVNTSRMTVLTLRFESGEVRALRVADEVASGLRVGDMVKVVRNHEGEHIVR